MLSVFCMTDSRSKQIALIVRLALAFMFCWHGLAPKLLWLSPDEIRMIEAHGWLLAVPIAQAAGVLEVLWGIFLLLWRRQRWPLLVSLLVLLGLLLDVAWFTPDLLVQAFNPLTSNLLAIALCWIGWLVEGEQRRQTGQPPA